MPVGTAVSGKDWGTGRKLDDSKRAMRGSFALLDIIPGVKAVSSFTKIIRASDILLNAGQTTKNSVKLGTNKMIAETAMNLKNTKKLVTSAVKNAETRIKNVQKQLDNLAKISEEKLKQQAFKTADSVDRLVTNMKNINLNPIEDVAFAGVGRIYLSVENTHTIRDMVSKIVKSSEKEINFGDVAKGTGEAVNLWRKSTCNNDELYNYLLKNVNIDVAHKFLNEGKWPDGIQIPKNSSVLNPDGSINWSKAAEGGYTLNVDGTARKEQFTPEMREVIDRYGNANGRYTSPVINGE